MTVREGEVEEFVLTYINLGPEFPPLQFHRLGNSCA